MEAPDVGFLVGTLLKAPGGCSGFVPKVMPMMRSTRVDAPDVASGSASDGDPSWVPLTMGHC
jgi:hypothetical protein